MNKDPFKEIKQSIKEFQKSMQLLLPALEEEITDLINSGEKDKNKIEYLLDTLLSLTDMGVGKDLFVKLLDYYKNIDAEGAEFYWNEYDMDED